MKSTKFRITLAIIVLLLIIQESFSQNIEKSIYLIGNTGTIDNPEVLSEIINDSKKAENPMLLFLGNSVNTDNPSKDFKNSITPQLDKLSSFASKTFFIPGKTEWSINGHKGVQSVEDYIQKNSASKFYPDDGEAIKHKNISENIVLITVDTQWFLEDWNKDTYINDNSEIKNRTLFFLEFENRIKKDRGKIILVALHQTVQAHHYGLMA